MTGQKTIRPRVDLRIDVAESAISTLYRLCIGAGKWFVPHHSRRYYILVTRQLTKGPYCNPPGRFNIPQERRSTTERVGRRELDARLICARPVSPVHGFVVLASNGEALKQSSIGRLNDFTRTQCRSMIYSRLVRFICCVPLHGMRRYK